MGCSLKEDGVWKLWHFIITTEIYCDYYKSWVDYNPTTSERQLPASDKPSRFGTLAYSAQGIAKLIPIPPEPYETYDGDTFYKE